MANDNSKCDAARCFLPEFSRPRAELDYYDCAIRVSPLIKEQIDSVGFHLFDQAKVGAHALACKPILAFHNIRVDLQFFLLPYNFPLSQDDC